MNITELTLRNVQNNSLEENQTLLKSTKVNIRGNINAINTMLDTIRILQLPDEITGDSKQYQILKMKIEFDEEKMKSYDDFDEEKMKYLDDQVHKFEKGLTEYARASDKARKHKLVLNESAKATVKKTKNSFGRFFDSMRRFEKSFENNLDRFWIIQNRLIRSQEAIASIIIRDYNEQSRIIHAIEKKLNDSKKQIEDETFEV